MSHLMKFTTWEQNGKWYTGDCSSLAKGSNYWWYVPRMMNMELTDYILLLKNKFNAKHFSFYPEGKTLLCFSFDTYKDCHNFTLWVNKNARLKKFFIE